MKNFYPEIITQLPEADVPFNGLKGWILQGENQQTVFFEIEPIGDVAKHEHGAQWGVVLDGEMELTIGGERKTYRKGDTYFIPAHVLHSASFKKKTYVMDFFADKDRYKPKN